MIDTMARADYERATRKAFWNRITSWLMGRSNDLLPFQEVRSGLPITSQHDVGLKEVPLERIVGSLGRYRDFDRAFLPIQTQTRDRWIRVDKAYYQDIILPPVELYKIGEVYFVKDGNHRISVARQREQAFIDAWVTEIETPVPITPDLDLDEILRRIEKTDFFLKTRLQSLRPDNQIRLTLPGYYKRLLEHIHVHRWFLGIENDREIEWEEAVQSWYDRVYLPLIEYIRTAKILADFPKRTETDLYVWIIEHRTILRGDPNKTSVEEAASDFVQKNSEKPSRKFLRGVRETIESLNEVTEEVLIDDMIVGSYLDK